jgi:uncharacterized membrane protein YccC
VVALVAVAGFSGVLSSLGDIGSATGLQLLVYTALGAGPVGALRPVWHTAAGFLAGVIWALILILPGWLRSPHGTEQRDVAAVYTALAQELRAIGTGDFTARRQGLTSALNTAYDELLTARSTATGRLSWTVRLAAALNASHLMTEAATALGRGPAAAAGHRHRRSAGRRDRERDPAAADPAAVGHQPGHADAAGRHGGRGAGAGEGLVTAGSGTFGVPGGAARRGGSREAAGSAGSGRSAAAAASGR